MLHCTCHTRYWQNKISAANKTTTPIAIGSEYQSAAALTATNTMSICSGPYATDDKASDDKIANAFVLDKRFSLNSVDFSGLPLNYPHLAVLRTLLEVGDSYEQCLLVSSCSKQRLHFF